MSALASRSLSKMYTDLLIDELAFESDDCIRITQHRPSTRAYSKELRARMNTRGVTPLLRVNRFLYLNASPVFYRIKKFVATAAERRHWDCHELSRSHPDRGTKFHSLEQFIRVIPTQHFGCIRHLQLNMDGDNCSWCCRSILDIVTCHFPGLPILELDRFCNERVPDLVSNPKKCQRVFERTLETLQRMRKLKKLQQLRITGFFKDLEFPRRVRESLKDVCRVDFFRGRSSRCQNPKIELGCGMNV